MKTILLVEDEKLIAETLERKLTEDGYHLVVSSQAEEGLEALTKKKIDLVILDLEVVGLSAFSFLARKNNHPLWKKIPTLVISNAGEVGELSQAKEAGAVDWVLKIEFSPEEVSQKVENIFQTKKTI